MNCGCSFQQFYILKFCAKKKTVNSDNKILEELKNKIPVENDFLFYYSVRGKKKVKNDYLCNFE